VTDAPWGKLAEHAPAGQAIPAGEEVTAPVPDTVTARERVAAVAGYGNRCGSYVSVDVVQSFTPLQDVGPTALVPV